MIDRIERYIRMHEMIAPGDRVVAGVSGGADSVCLLLVLEALRERLGFSLDVVHVEHGIRGGESLEDAAFVRELCGRLGVPFALRSFDVPRVARERHLTVEEAARMCRYQAFEEAAGVRRREAFPEAAGVRWRERPPETAEVCYQREMSEEIAGVRRSEAFPEAAGVRWRERPPETAEVCYQREMSEEIAGMRRSEASAEAAEVRQSEASAEVAAPCWGHKGVKIAVAHNRDDQAETLLLNLCRGTGVRGMCGMRPVNGRIIHPLLGVSRKEIEAYLALRGQEFRMDSTNLSRDYTRNKLRQVILPAMEEGINAETKAHLAAAGERFLRVQEFMERLAAERAGELTVRREAGEVWIDRRALLAEKEVLQEYILQYFLASDGRGLKDVGAVHLEAVKKLAAGQSGRRISLPGGRVVRCTGGFLVLGEQPETQSCARRGNAEKAESCARRGNAEKAESCARRGSAEVAESCAHRGNAEKAESCARRGSAEVAESCAHRGSAEVAESCAWKGSAEKAESCARRGSAEVAESCARKGSAEMAESCARRGSAEMNESCARRESAEKAETLAETPLAVPGVTHFGGLVFQTSLEEWKNEIIPGNLYTKWLDYDTIKNTIQLRTRRSGDYLVVNGGRRKLKKYFIDEKVLQEQRGEVPLLADGSHILWVVGGRISEACRITGHTQRVLKIQMMEEK